MPKPNEEKLPKAPFPWLGMAIAFAALSAVALIYWWIEGLYSATDPKTIVRYLCDGFFAAGAAGIGVGLLVWIGNQGIFNGLSFAVQKIISKFVPSMKVATMSYGDFLEDKGEKHLQFWYIIAIGGAFLIASIVCLMIFYNGQF